MWFKYGLGASALSGRVEQKLAKLESLIIKFKVPSSKVQSLFALLIIKFKVQSSFALLIIKFKIQSSK